MPNDQHLTAFSRATVLYEQDTALHEQATANKRKPQPCEPQEQQSVLTASQPCSLQAAAIESTKDRVCNDQYKRIQQLQQPYHQVNKMSL